MRRMKGPAAQPVTHDHPLIESQWHDIAQEMPPVDQQSIANGGDVLSTDVLIYATMPNPVAKDDFIYVVSTGYFNFTERKWFYYPWCHTDMLFMKLWEEQYWHALPPLPNLAPQIDSESAENNPLTD